MTTYSVERRMNIAAGKRRFHEQQWPLRVLQFWGLVEKTPGCWLWRGSVNNSGYGQWSFRGRMDGAHRVAYRLTRGPIPKGMTLDHKVCGNPLCVNPSHMEVTTPRVNVLRSSCPSACNARKTHCKRGHEFSPENTRVDSGGHRWCRTCERERSAWRRQHDPKLKAWLQRVAKATGGA